VEVLPQVAIGQTDADRRVLTSGVPEAIVVASVSESTPALSQPNDLAVRLKLNTQVGSKLNRRN